MSQQVILGIDLGTSSVKVIALDRTSAVVAEASSPYTTSHPRPGWDEQDPAEWWRALGQALHRLRAAPELVDMSVAGIGLSGQMHGAVPIDEHGRPVRPAIIWSDARTIAEVGAIERCIDRTELVAITGNRANTGFTAPKILWLRDHEPESYVRTRAIIQPKDAIRLRLTDSVAGDVSDASATLLFDLRARTWSDSLCATLGIERGLLPPLFEATEPAGGVGSRAADELGLAAGIPVAAGGGDAPCAALGVGLAAPRLADRGPLLLTLGTAGQAFAVTAEPKIEPEGRTHALCHVVPGTWYQMGAILQAGAAVEWLARVIGGRRATARIFEAAATVPAGADGLIFLPYLTGERTPHFDPHARGAFVGLGARHGAGHLARAVLEGVAFALRDAAGAMAACGIQWSGVRVTGGGARARIWRQILADVFGEPVELGPTAHGSARGAALLGAVAAGWYASASEAAATADKAVDIVEPTPEAVDREADLFDIYRELHGRLAEVSARLTSPPGSGKSDRLPAAAAGGTAAPAVR